MTIRGTSQFRGLDDGQLQWLRQLHLPWRTAAWSGAAGERRALRGRGNEPELLRRYQYGDDVRRIDWPATLRLQRPTVRQPHAVMPGRVQVLLDTSPSMHVISTKWERALEITASSGVVATAHADMVCGITETPSAWVIDTTQWLDWVRTVTVSSDAYRPRMLPSSQMRICISDLWHDDPITTIAQLATHTDQLIIVHLLSTQELDPEVGGEITLCDSEDNTELTVTMTAELVQQYHERLTAWRTRIQDYCRAHAVTYVACHDQQSLASCMLEVTQ